MSASPTSAAASASFQQRSVMEGARQLQDRLHELLSRVTAAAEHVKHWPEAKGDDASIHVESTTKLIALMRQILASIQKMESHVQTNATLRQSLQSCPIPLDLLDLMDTTLLNPDCFLRGLLREALGQLAGLKRRKLALELLGTTVEQGMLLKQEQRRQKQQKQPQKDAAASATEKRRELANYTQKSKEGGELIDNIDDNDGLKSYNTDTAEDDDPPAKRARV